MKTLLKVLGWIFVFIAVVGGPQLIAREGLTGINFTVELIYIGLTALCFWGAKRLKKKGNDSNPNQN